MEYASKGVAGAGLGLGIAGTALGLLTGGGAGLNNMLGGRTAYPADAAAIVQAVASIINTTQPHCSDSVPATRYDLQNMKELMAKDREIAILKSEQNTEIKIADVFERIMTRVNADQRAQADWNAQQMVNNAQMSAAIAANATSISALQNCCQQITKLVVPNTAICPGWGDVTVTPA